MNQQGIDRLTRHLESDENLELLLGYATLSNGKFVGILKLSSGPNVDEFTSNPFDTLSEAMASAERLGEKIKSIIIDASPGCEVTGGHIN